MKSSQYIHIVLNSSGALSLELLLTLGRFTCCVACVAEAVELELANTGALVPSAGPLTRRRSVIEGG